MREHDLFSLAIEQRDQKIRELEAELEDKRIALASVLGYMRSQKIGQGHYGMGVRRMVKNTLRIAA